MEQPYKVFRFEGYTLDLTRGCLRSAEREIDLRPKSFELLRYLVEHAGHLVPKDELIGAIWPNVFVTDDSLTRCVSDVRLALGDEAQKIIKTVPRRGYLFAATVSQPTDGKIDAVDPIAHQRAGHRRHWRWRVLAAAVASVAIAATILYWRQPVGLALPDRPSIAVLPLVNLAGEAQTDYFSDGLSEDLTTGLSRFSDLFVIARTSAFRFKASQLQPNQIGRELGVRYLLYGSVRRQDVRLRLNVQLVEAETGKQLWAERYDRPLNELFVVHDEVIENIVGTLVAHITRAELARASRRHPQNLAAYDHLLQGNAVFRNVTQGRRGEVLARSRALYEQSIAADGMYAPAFQALANNYVFAYLEPTDVEPISLEYQHQDVLDRALALARRATELDPALPEAYATLAWVLHWQYRRNEALAMFERALSLNPNLADGRYSLMLTHGGRASEGIVVMRRIMRLDPFHPPIYFGWLGNAQYVLGQYEAAHLSLSVVASRQQQHRPTQVWFAAVAAQLGRDNEAKMAAARVLLIEPNFTIARWLKLLQLARPEDATRLAEGMRKAGLPE